MEELKLATPFGEVTLRGEPGGDQPPSVTYPETIDLAGAYWPDDVGVWLEGRPRALLSGAGGRSGMGPGRGAVWRDRLMVVAGEAVACFGLKPFVLAWAIKTTAWTCFDLHVDEARDALIVRGEGEILRLSPDGEVLWSASGADIFTGDFALKLDWIEVEDFNGRRYRFDYDTGREL